MPEEGVVTRDATGGGPATPGQAGGSPGTPEPSAAPTAQGAGGSAAPPQGGSPGTAPDGGANVDPALQAAMDRAAQFESNLAEERTRRSSMQTEFQRLKSAEKTLKERFGDNYLESIQSGRAGEGSQPPQPQPTAPPAPQPTAAQAVQQGLPVARIAEHIGNTFRALYGGFTEQKYNPDTAQMEPVHVPADPAAARDWAMTHDLIFRQNGIQPPWEGYYGLGNKSNAAPAPARDAMDTSQFATRDQVPDMVESLLDWDDAFCADVAAIGKHRLGDDFFQQQVEMTRQDGSKVQIPMEKALRRMCRPSAERPSGVPVWVAVTQNWPDRVAERMELVATARARAGTPGVMPGGAASGVAMDPSRAKQIADYTQQHGLSGATQGGHFVAQRPADQARIIVDVDGGRDRR